jgi:hypothetical protein
VRRSTARRPVMRVIISQQLRADTGFNRDDGSRDQTTHRYLLLAPSGRPKSDTGERVMQIAGHGCLVTCRFSVGVAGFEPAASSSRRQSDTRIASACTACTGWSGGRSSRRSVSLASRVAESRLTSAWSVRSCCSMCSSVAGRLWCPAWGVYPAGEHGPVTVICQLHTRRAPQLPLMRPLNGRARHRSRAGGK